MPKVELERVYSLKIRQKMKKYPRWLRAKKSIKYIRKFLARHMKVDPENVKIDASVNEKVWERGAEKPPARIRIRAVKFDDGIVEAELA
ncbi:50S ribosomal protein L31e [Archaeoglobales archaeon ex4484_92]|nr:MAG: 50S ribosomal protein L31e [Archaeoglobales archaeon ex4484_92]HDN74071.1 50S ribosomal protein L31e [Archaeoglobus sp.]